MPRRLIDISVTMDNETPADPASMRPAIQYKDHNAGFADFAKLLPGLKREDLPDGQAAAIESIQLTTHNGTHLDAPYHFHSTNALRPLEIILVNTRAGSRYGQPDYIDTGCGMGYEATMYLLERGVRLTGTDGWSWDAPFSHTVKKYLASGNANLIWEGHKAGRHIGYCHLEKLHNLEALPSDGFYVSCFPAKIRSASAGWTRAVAILDDALTGQK